MGGGVKSENIQLLIFNIYIEFLGHFDHFYVHTKLPKKSGAGWLGVQKAFFWASLMQRGHQM